VSGTKSSGRKLSPERKQLLDNAVADGWPIRQIISTYGIGTSTIKKHYPDYRGMTDSHESGKMSWQNQHVLRDLKLTA
jgi:hypothetical protein